MPILADLEEMLPLRSIIRVDLTTCGYKWCLEMGGEQGWVIMSVI